jgi:hypothetical protein
MGPRPLTGVEILENRHSLYGRAGAADDDTSLVGNGVDEIFRRCFIST